MQHLNAGAGQKRHSNAMAGAVEIEVQSLGSVPVALQRVHDHARGHARGPGPIVQAGNTGHGTFELLDRNARLHCQIAVMQTVDVDIRVARGARPHSRAAM